MNPLEAQRHMMAAFGNRLDKSGVPEWHHSVAVARNVILANMSDEIVSAAFLHDVIEDTDYSLEGFLTPGELNTVQCLTHLPDEGYLDSYIERVCKDTAACYVKLSDLCVNIARGKYPGESTRHHDRRMRKYDAAKRRIWQAVPLRGETDVGWWPAS